MPNPPTQMMTRADVDALKAWATWYGCRNQLEWRDASEKYENLPSSQNHFVVRCEADAPAPASEGPNACHHRFVAFGFSKTRPFTPPGTTIVFVRKGHGPAQCDGECCSLCCPYCTATKVVGMMCAKGKRPMEYAVFISFSNPVPAEYVQAMLGSSFNVTELESPEEALESTHQLVDRYTMMWGYMDEGMILPSSEAFRKAVASWKPTLDRHYRRTRKSEQRMIPPFGMGAYTEALKRVNALPCCKEGGSETLPEASAGSKKRLRPEDDSPEASCPRFENANTAGVHLEQRLRRTVGDAYDRFEKGFLGTLCTNPVAIKDYNTHFADFMLIEAGAPSYHGSF